MSTIEVNKIIPRTGTTLTVGDSGDTLDFNGTKILGHGQYVVEKVDVYTYGTEVSTTSATTYLDIAGGNYLSFTPTSSSDYIILTGHNSTRIGADSKGLGLAIMRATTSSISSSDTNIAVQGNHTFYLDGASNNYMPLTIIANDTSLTAGTTYYYEMYGRTYNSTGTRTFNASTQNSNAQGQHQLIGIHYKYIGT